MEGFYTTKREGRGGQVLPKQTYGGGDDSATKRFEVVLMLDTSVLAMLQGVYPLSDQSFRCDVFYEKFWYDDLSDTVLNRLVQFNVIRRYVKTNSIHTTHRLNALAAPPGIRV